MTRSVMHTGMHNQSNVQNRVIQVRVWICIIVMGTALLCERSRPMGNPVSVAYQRLDAIRRDRKKMLLGYMQSLQRRAETIPTDSTMGMLFSLKRKLYHLQEKGRIVPRSLHQKVKKLEIDAVFSHAIKYRDFYDILFVDSGGTVFHSILKQADYKTNLFLDTHGVLSRKLSKVRPASFVDFSYYTASGEPSAFFTLPCRDQGIVTGWFVLQCALNKINNMLSIDENLGATGEVLLVNKSYYMLTDSRFYRKSTALQLRLSETNIRSKFAAHRGHKSVNDYRGKDVLTSFEVFSFLNAEWLLIAKIDLREVVTSHYAVHSDQIWEQLSEKGFPVAVGRPEHSFPAAAFIHVDMDEYR